MLQLAKRLAGASRGLAPLGLPDDELFFWTRLGTLGVVVAATAACVERAAWRRA